MIDSHFETPPLIFGSAIIVFSACPVFHHRLLVDDGTARLKGCLLVVLPELPIVQTSPAPYIPAAGDALPASLAAGKSGSWTVWDEHRRGMRIQSCFQRTYVSLLCKSLMFGSLIKSNQAISKLTETAYLLVQASQFQSEPTPDVWSW